MSVLEQHLEYFRHELYNIRKLGFTLMQDKSEISTDTVFLQFESYIKLDNGDTDHVYLAIDFFQQTFKYWHNDVVGQRPKAMPILLSTYINSAITHWNNLMSAINRNIIKTIGSDVLPQ